MRTSNLLVSALCVTCDRPGFLEQAVRWFEAQTWPRKELVVVDDSRPQLRANLSRHRGVNHVILDQSMNMGEKHNLAMEAAQGGVLCYQDDDDWFGPRRMMVQLEPIALEEVSITGFARDYVVRIPGGSFWKFLPISQRPAPHLWLNNGIGHYRLGLHDGTAMFRREVLRHGIVHPPIKVRQKVQFLDDLAAAGERWKELPNNGHFVYARHARNTWNFEESTVLYPVSAPHWIPPEVLDFWRAA